MKTTNFIFTFLFIITIGCGSKVQKQNEFLDFDIAEIETRGDSEINYKTKNKLLNKCEKNEKKFYCFGNKKQEKKHKNQITKYFSYCDQLYFNVNNNVTGHLRLQQVIFSQDQYSV